MSYLVGLLRDEQVFNFFDSQLGQKRQMDTTNLQMYMYVVKYKGSQRQRQ